MKTVTPKLLVVLAVLASFTLPVEGKKPDTQPTVSLLASGFGALFGSTVGPDGALYVAEPENGRVLRIDPQTGSSSVFCSGLPVVYGFGAIDVVFLDSTAYVLVTLVDPTAGGPVKQNYKDGIYRVDGPNSFTVIADIGQYALNYPPRPTFEIDVPSGLQFAITTYRGNFIVTDGHHNRVYRVTRSGQVSEIIAFDDIVPTGVTAQGKTIYLAQAGPVPHLPENGKILAFTPGSPTAVEVASGARLLVDVKFGLGDRLFALSQGQFPVGSDPGTPALPNTGSLVEAQASRLQAIVTGLNDPTAMEFIGNTAYVVTLAGEIWKIQLPNPSRKPGHRGPGATAGTTH